jgi:hypothetical protein
MSAAGRASGSRTAQVKLARFQGGVNLRSKRSAPPPASEVCPTREKALYRSRGEAKSAALLNRREKPSAALRAYHCRCGFWHLASDWESG